MTSSNTTTPAQGSDWDELARQWQHSTPVLDEAESAGHDTEARGEPEVLATSELVRRVRRQSRLLWAVGAAELTVCLITLLLAADFAWGPRRSEPWSLPTAAGLTLLVFVAGRQAWSTRRGLWNESSAHDHAGYLRLLRRRLEAREQGLAFSQRLTVALFAAFCVWLPLTRSEGLLGSFVFLVFWCGCAAGWIWWLVGRARREREGLDALEHALHGDDGLER